MARSHGSPLRSTRSGAVFGAVALAITALVCATPVGADANTWCANEFDGSWNVSESTCDISVRSPRNATATLAVSAPAVLRDDPTAGPVIHDYLSTLVTNWRREARNMVRDSTKTVDHDVYSAGGNVKSVVFHEHWHTLGVEPSDTYRTFTFDLDRRRRLELADLFVAGFEPLTALPPLIRPYLVEALDRAEPPHEPGTYPFTAQEWEPGPDGSGYSSNYRAFAISDDELILYLPDAPMSHENPTPQDRLVWSMNGGTVTVHIPRSALTPVLSI